MTRTHSRLRPQQFCLGLDAIEITLGRCALPISRVQGVQGFVKKIDIDRLLSDLAFKFGNLRSRVRQFTAAALGGGLG
jgi:hypothetical protein